MPDPEEAVPFILEAVRLVRSQLEPEQALVGFCGGPFTVAGYLVEGKPTRDFVQTKRCMYGSPEVWHGLMEKLTETSIAYLRAKVAAGADVVQLFDSWIGALSRADYEEFVAPYSARILASVDVPTIHFGTGTAHLLEAMARRRGRRDRARLARGARRGLAASRLRPGRAGQSRPGAPARALRADARRGAWDPRVRRRAARATSSTSATACCRRPIPRI